MRRSATSVSNECPWEAGETLRREIKPTNRANAIVSVNKTVENRRKFDGFGRCQKFGSLAPLKESPTAAARVDSLSVAPIGKVQSEKAHGHSLAPVSIK